MTDRELLELAAKANGVRHEGIYFADKGIRLGENGNGYTSWIEWWNPLADDGDALRLAVGLGLRIYTPDEDDKTAVVRDYAGLHVIQEASATDFCAATRRAIVRAAAEIGRAMS